MMSKEYKVLNKQVFSKGVFSIVPIRYEDRIEIMNWRNEQIYHLRQNLPLSISDQENYFSNIVSKLFISDSPNQILFSLLENGICVGYGGLVHINWADKYAEISFLMNTSLEANFFEAYWQIFLELLEQVAFEELGFHKIFTYAFDLRPKLYPVLEHAGFTRQATLKKHSCFNGQYIDVVIHEKFNHRPFIKRVNFSDSELLYKWAINPSLRAFSKNKDSFSWEDHQAWFSKRLNNKDCFFYLLMHEHHAVGSIRFEREDDHSFVISYQVDPMHHGKGFGTLVLELGLIEITTSLSQDHLMNGWVMNSNIASKKIFQKLGFNLVATKDNFELYQILVHANKR